MIAPTVSSVSASGTGIAAGNIGDLDAGKMVTLTLKMSSAVTVNGIPTLTLSDGATAVYDGGSGTNTLTFNYVVGAGQNTTASGLGITAVNLPNGASIIDASGNNATFAGALTSFANLQIDTAAPAALGSGGNLGMSSTFTNPNGPNFGNYVFSGGPTDGSKPVPGNTVSLYQGATFIGSATVKGDGSWTVTTTLPVQTASDSCNNLHITAYQTDPAGNVSAASPVYVVNYNSLGLVSSVTSSVVSGSENAGKTLTFTMHIVDGNNHPAVATVTGVPTLSLNDGGVATYVSGSGTSALTFSYTVAAGQNVSGLAITGVNLPNGAAIISGGLNVDLTTALGSFPNLTIDTIAPVAPSIASDTVNANNSVTLAGSAEAGSTVTVYDGTTALGTTTAGGNGSWVYITPVLGAGTQNFTATATDAAGNVSAPSSLLSVNVGGSSGPAVVNFKSSSTGDLNAGHTLTLTMNMSEAVTVAGAPKLVLNDGGVATYVSGSGTNALTFSYTVASGQNAATLGVNSVNLNGGSIKDASGNAAVLGGVTATFAGLTIDTAPPAAPVIKTDSIAANVVTLTGTAEANSTVTVYDGSAALGTATADATGAWTYKSGILSVGAHAFTATATDGAGNTGTPSSALALNLTTTRLDGITMSAPSADLNAGKVVTLTLAMNGAPVTVTGKPTLTLNDGGTATYVSGSGTSALTFSYTVAAGQNVAALKINSINLPTGTTIKDGSGHAVNLTLSGLTQAGPMIDTKPPGTPTITADTVNLNAATLSGAAEANSTVTVYDGTSKIGTATASSTGAWSFTTATLAAGTHAFKVSATDGAGNVSAFSATSSQIIAAPPTLLSIAETPASSNLGVGKTVTLTLNLSSAVTVTGTPTLTLNDGGTATYAGGSGSNALTFSYTVAAGDHTPALKVTGINLPIGAAIADSVNNPLNASALGSLIQAGPMIDGVAPNAPVISADTISANKATLTGTAEANSQVAVYNGSSLLGTATANGSGAWSYMTATLANGTYAFEATATDAAGNVSAASTPLIVPIGVTASPVVLSANASGKGIANNVGDLNAGHMVTLTLKMSSAVTVNGIPTLTLSDGATAVYDGGSGTNTLTFNYVVGAGQNTTASGLGITAVNLPNGASIIDASGNNATFAGALTSFANLQIDTAAPAALGSGGNLGMSSTFTNPNGPNFGNYVFSGGPTDGSKPVPGNTVSLYQGATFIGSATVKGDGSWTVTTTLPVQTASDSCNNLHITAYQTDPAGNVSAASPVYVVNYNSLGLVSSVTSSVVSGSENAGKTLTFTMHIVDGNNHPAVATVTGVPTLSLNDGGVATYVSGSGTSALTFSYTVAAGQNVSGLAITGVNLPNGAAIISGGLNVDLTTALGSFPNLTIDTIAPVAPSIASDTVNANNSVTLAGSAEAGSTVTVYDGTTALGTTTAGGNGSWVYITPVLGAGTQSFTATATDAAGNVSGHSTDSSVIIRAAALFTQSMSSLGGNSGFGSSSPFTAAANHHAPILLAAAH